MAKKKTTAKPKLMKLTLLLNQASVLFKMKLTTPSAMALEIGKPFPRVHEWIVQRKFKPNGDVTLAIQERVKDKTKRLRGHKKERFERLLESLELHLNGGAAVVDWLKSEEEEGAPEE